MIEHDAVQLEQTEALAQSPGGNRLVVSTDITKPESLRALFVRTTKPLAV